MIEGLWIVQFEGLQGEGSGVVVLKDGRALGGDEGYTYVGRYNEENGDFTARVTVSNFRRDIANVMGIVGDFELEITAPAKDGVIQGSMGVVGNMGARIAVKLTKKANF